MGEQFTAEEVRRHLIDECAEAGSQKIWADRHGLSQAYVSDVARGRRNPGEGIAAALGLRRAVFYVDDLRAAPTRSSDGGGCE